MIVTKFILREFNMSEDNFISSDAPREFALTGSSGVLIK